MLNPQQQADFRRREETQYPTFSTLQTAHEKLRGAVDNLVKLQGPPLIEASVSVIQWGSLIHDSATRLRFDAPNRAERKAAERICGEFIGYEFAKHIAHVIIDGRNLEDYLSFFRSNLALLRDGSVRELAYQVASVLIERGTSADSGPKEVEVFRLALDCAELLYRAGQQADDSEERSELMGEFYRVLDHSGGANKDSLILRPMLAPYLERAIKEQDAYLSAHKIHGGCCAIWNNEENASVFRTYFIIHYSGDESLHVKTLKEAPAFGLHIAGSIRPMESREYCEAAADALLRVGDYLWRCWQADHSAEGAGTFSQRGKRDPYQEFEWDLHSCASLCGGRDRNYMRTVRDVHRALSRQQEAAKAYYKKAKGNGEHHQVILDAFAGGGSD